MQLADLLFLSALTNIQPLNNHALECARWRPVASNEQQQTAMGAGLPFSSSPRQQRSDDFLRYTLLAISSVCVVLLLLNAKATLSRSGSPTGAVAEPDAPRVAASPLRTHVTGDAEIWALGPPDTLTEQQQALAAALGPAVLSDLKQLCGRCLYRTLTSYVRVHDFGRVSVVLTGDIPAMWIRDSAVQMATYLPRITRRPALRAGIEGAIRAQAYFILQDPWANAYNPQYVPPTTLPKHERQLGRGGWVWNRNFELDSIAYFFNFLWNYHQTPSIWKPEELLGEAAVHDAVVLLLKVLMIEQHHEQLSPYRYSELERGGLGKPTGYTGMVWSAFRPSDDPQVYGYNVPDNMYLWGSLSRLLQLNGAVWQDAEVEGAVLKLMEEVHAGIMAYGVTEVEPGVSVYAYEVDGLGAALVDFDDPNLPSLLAMPLLGYSLYSRELYTATRARILDSDTNPFYFNGTELHGLGSPHTEPDFVWPLATAVDALTTANATRQLELLGLLLKMAAGNGLVHESVHVDYTTRFSRPEFGWANAMTVVMLEHLLGVDCDMEAEKHRLKAIAEREANEQGEMPNGDTDSPKYYEQLEAGIIHVGGKGTADGGGDGDEQHSNWQQLLEDQMSQQMQQDLLQKVMGIQKQQQEQQQQPAAAAADDAAGPPEKPVVPEATQQQQQQQQQPDATAAADSQDPATTAALQQLVMQEYAKTLQANQ